MPASLTTINIAKDQQGATYQPLLLAEFTFGDGSVLRLSTHPLNTAEGGVQYGGYDYLGRISEQSIQQIQALSESGVDLIPNVTLSIADPASYIYTNWELASGKGFKGAQLTLRFVFYDIASGTFSSDSRIPFVGVCEHPASDAAKLTVTATAKTGMMRALLPIVPIQQRCPWVNPTTTAQRALASNEDSAFYECGETRDTTTAPPCSYTLATCTQLNRFGGITYSAPAGMRVREYTSGNWSDVRGITNEAAYGDRIPMLYGTAWIEPPVLTAIPDGNYLRGECIVCLGQADILKVVVNGITLSPANEHDGTPIGGANADYRYNWINDGTRDGSPNLDTPWNGNGDPYGSMTVIMFVLPRVSGGGEGVPRVRVLAKRKELRKYQQLTSIVVASNVATATLVGANTDIASNDPTWPFTIEETSGTTIDAAWTGLTNWTAGPPGTFVFSTSGVADGTYTGGRIRYKAATENVAWIIADILTWTNYTYDDLDIDSFCQVAQVLESRPCSMVLRQRRSASEIIRSLRQAYGLVLVPEHSTGKLKLQVKQTLADQQPATIDGSNWNTAVSSITAAGVTTNGYVAYRFDAGSILRSDLPISLKELPRASADSPNRIQVAFQDRDNDYAISTLSVVDSDDTGRMDGQEVAGGLAATPDGLTSYADAMRAARVSLAEIHRGNVQSDTRGTRVFEWETTFRALHLRVGQLVLLNDTLKDLSEQLVRIVKLQPSQNYETVKVTAHWHDDDWYTDAFAATGALDAGTYTPPPFSSINPADIGGTMGTNLVRNPGFELGITNWYGSIPLTGVEVVQAAPDTGMSCLKVSATSATEVHQPYFFEDGSNDVMPCSPGEQFTFRGRYKFDAASSATTAQARVAFYQADGTYIDSTTATLDTAETTWADFTMSATAPALSKYMGIFPWFGTLTAGAVYLDTLWAEKASTADLAPGHVTIATFAGGDVKTIRGQLYTEYSVTGVMPAAGVFNNCNAIEVYHYRSDGQMTAVGALPTVIDPDDETPTFAQAGETYTAKFLLETPVTESLETVRVIARNSFASADWDTAPTKSALIGGVTDIADEPANVDMEVLSGDYNDYALHTTWDKGDQWQATSGYEILFEFYDDSLCRSERVNPGGGSDVVYETTTGFIAGADTVKHTTAYTQKTSIVYVRAFVRAVGKFGDFSDWVWSINRTIGASTAVVTPQPASDTWSIDTIVYGANEKVQRAGLPVNLLSLTTGVDYYTVWMEIDGVWQAMLNCNTVAQHTVWIDQPKTATNIPTKLVGNDAGAYNLPGAGNDTKTFNVAAWAGALQCSTFTVTLDSATVNGKTMYRLKYDVTAPSDVNRMGVAIQARWTDASWNPLAGNDGAWKEVSWIKSNANSLTWYSSDGYDFPAPKTGSEYKQFRAIPKNYANEENTTAPITVNSTFASDGGFKATAIDGSTVTDGLTVDGTSIKVNYTTAEFSISAGKLTVNGVPMAKATGFDTAAFEVTGGAFTVKEIAASKIVTGTLGVGVVYAGAVNVSQLAAGTATFSGDVKFERGSGGPSVTINSSSVLLANGTSSCEISGSSIEFKLGSAQRGIFDNGGSGGTARFYSAGSIAAANDITAGGQFLGYDYYVLTSGTSGRFYLDTASTSKLRVHNIEILGTSISITSPSSFRTALGLGTAATSASTDFAAASHSHSWSAITDKPTTFTPSSHSHAISDVTGLQTALDGKAPAYLDAGDIHYNANSQTTVGGALNNLYSRVIALESA